MVRVPSVSRLIGPAIQRVPPSWSLRRALVEHRIRQIYEALNRQDMEVFLVLGCHPAVELYTAKDQAGVPFGADFDDVYYGRDGVAAFFRNWLGAWEDYRIEPEEVIDCGDKLVVFLLHCGRGKGSGLEVEHHLAQVIHLRNAVGLRVEIYWDRLHALEAAGLREHAMSQENVERLRRSYEVFNLTQQTELDLWATDIEYVQTADVGAGETVYRGREGVVQAIGELTDAFEGLRVEPEEFFDLGDRVLAFVRLRGRARRSGVPVDAGFAHLATFRGSEITHWRAYARREEALEAAGISGSRVGSRRPWTGRGFGWLPHSVVEWGRRARRGWAGLARRSSHRR
jgi:ketosteroid isomerase-like protein